MLSPAPVKNSPVLFPAPVKNLPVESRAASTGFVGVPALVSALASAPSEPSMRGVVSTGSAISAAASAIRLLARGT